jgi:hypothetical protein
MAKTSFEGGMEIENQKKGFIEGERTKTPERYISEAESGVARSRIGSLEDVRFRLGLSRRKMCQLLLVDPSAWTRWTKPGSDAPPHIYRALEWYLLLTEKFPGMGNPFWLATLRAQPTENARVTELERTIGELNQRLAFAESKIDHKGVYKPTKNPYFLMILVGLISVIMGFALGGWVR